MTESKVAKETTALPGKRGPVIFFDFARGVSAQAVVLGHAFNLFLPGIFMAPGKPVFYIQSFAVIIFFVLSGFLITSAVLKKKDVPEFTFGSYLIDRVARVVYPLIPALLLILLGDFLVFRGSIRLPFDYVDLSPQAIAAAFTMLFNNPILQELAPLARVPWLSAGPLGSGAPLWSVVAEWWIYVAFGVLVFIAFRKLKPGFFTGLLLVLSIAVPVGYMAKGGFESLAWIIGMLYAFGVRKVAALPRAFHVMMVIVGVGAFLVGLRYTGMDLHSAATIIPASVAFCHLYFVVENPYPAEGAAPLNYGPVFRKVSLFLSSFSYSLYLLHFSVLSYLWFFLHGRLPAVVLIVLSLVLSNVVAYGFYLLVERHFHRVGKFLKRSLLRG